MRYNVSCERLYHDPRHGTMDTGTPALTRGLAVLRALSAHREGLSAAELARLANAPRATLYRILRTLVAEGYAGIAPGADGRYVLGAAARALGAPASEARDLVAAARPFMDALSALLGETVKLVARDGLEVVTLAVAIPRRDFCIASRIGNRLPLHVGASQRLLLAHAPESVRRAVLDGPLPRVTGRTVTSRARLARDLASLASVRDLAGHGEGVEGVGATSALVGPAGVEPAAALVAVYVYASQGATRLRAIRAGIVEAADALTRSLAPLDAPATQRPGH